MPYSKASMSAGVVNHLYLFITLIPDTLAPPPENHRF